MKDFIAFLLLLFLGYGAFAVPSAELDSIKVIISESDDDTLVVAAYLRWGEMIYLQEPDSALSLWNDALVICEKSLTKSLSKAIINKLKDQKANAYINSGVILKEQGNIDKALEYYLLGMDIFLELNYKEGLGSVTNNIGMIYKGQGMVDKALEYYDKALAYYVETGDSLGMGILMSNIGRIYMAKKQFEKTLEYYDKSMSIQEKIDDRQGIAYSLMNIGIVYHEQGKLDKALEYYPKVLEILEELGDKKGIAYALDRIGNIYYQKGNLEKATEYAEKVLKIGRDLGFPQQVEQSAGSLKNIYRKQQNWQKAFSYFELEIQMRDSIINEDNSRKSLEQEARYKYAKMAMADSINHVREMEIKNNELAVKDEKNKRQQQLILVFVIGLAILLVFSLLLSRLFMQKRKAFRLLAVQNEEIQQKNEEITAQRDEIEAQRDRLSWQNEEITDSINYAKRIQKAVLPSNFESAEVLGEHFIIFKPKDIVSGDFYYMTIQSNWLIITVADCTGHGVPGSLMSMLGMSFIKEIVHSKEITSAAVALNELRRSVIKSLSQSRDNDKTSEDKVSDGMDISFVAIDTLTMKCQYSGANNPLYLVRKRSIVEGVLKISTDDSEEQLKPTISGDLFDLFELKPSKMPIGIYGKMDDFKYQDFDIMNGDILYFFTDGFADQFGGPNGKKFQYKQFKKLILSNSHLDLKAQGELMEQTLNNWMENQEQIDDITVLGVKIEY